MVHVPHADDELAGIIQPVLPQNALSHGHLFERFAAARLRDGREPHGASATPPVVEGEFLEGHITAHQGRAILEGRIVPRFLLRKDFRLAGFAEGVRDDLPIHVNLLLGAIQGGVHVPHTQLMVLHDLPHRVVSDRSGPGHIVAPLGLCRRLIERMGDHDRIGDDAADAKRPDGLDDFHDVVFVFVLNDKGLERGRGGHQPESELGDDAVIGLGEDPIQVRSISPLEDLPGVGLRQRAHPRAQHLAVREDDFHPAGKEKMFSIGRIPDAAIQRIAGRPGNGRRGGTGEPERILVFLDVIVELFVRDTRFDEGETEIRIDFQDAVHPFQIEHHLTPFGRRGRTIPEVPTGRDHPDRDFVFVADRDNLLDLFDRRSLEGGRRSMVRVRDRHHGLDVRGKLFRRDKDGILAQDTAEFGDRCLKSFLRDAFR